MAPTPTPRPSTPPASQKHALSAPLSPDPLALPVNRFSSLTGKRKPGFGIPAELKPTASSPAVTPNKIVKRRAGTMREGKKLDGMKVDVGMKSEGQSRWVGGIVFTPHLKEGNGNGKGWRVRINVEAEKEGFEDAEVELKKGAGARSTAGDDCVVLGQDAETPRKKPARTKSSTTPRKAAVGSRRNGSRNTMSTVPLTGFTDTEGGSEANQGKKEKKTPSDKRTTRSTKSKGTNKTPKKPKMKTGASCADKEDIETEQQESVMVDQNVTEVAHVGLESHENNEYEANENNLSAKGTASSHSNTKRRNTRTSCAAKSANVSPGILNVTKRNSTNGTIIPTTAAGWNFSNISNTSNVSLTTLTPPASSSPVRDSDQIREDAANLSRASSICSNRSSLSEMDDKSVNSRDYSIASSLNFTVGSKRGICGDGDADDGAIDWTSFCNDTATVRSSRNKEEGRKVVQEKEKENTATVESVYPFGEYEASNIDGSSVSSSIGHISELGHHKQWQSIPPLSDTVNEIIPSPPHPNQSLLTTAIKLNLGSEDSKGSVETDTSIRSTFSSRSTDARAAKIRERWAVIGRTSSNTSRISEMSQEISVLPTEKGRPVPKVVIPVKGKIKHSTTRSTSRDSSVLEPSIRPASHFGSSVSEISRPPEKPLTPSSPQLNRGIKNNLTLVAPNAKKRYIEKVEFEKKHRQTPDISRVRRTSISLQGALSIGGVSRSSEFGGELSQAAPVQVTHPPSLAIPGQSRVSIGEIILNAFTSLRENPASSTVEEPDVNVQVELEQDLSASSPSASKEEQDVEKTPKRKDKGKGKASDGSNLSTSKWTEDMSSTFSSHITRENERCTDLQYPNLAKATAPSPIISYPNLNVSHRVTLSKHASTSITPTGQITQTSDDTKDKPGHSPCSGSPPRIYSDQTLENMYAAEREEVIQKATGGEVSVIVIDDTINSASSVTAQDGIYEEGETTLFMRELDERVMKGVQDGKGVMFSSTPHVKRFLEREGIGISRRISSTPDQARSAKLKLASASLPMSAYRESAMPSAVIGLKDSCQESTQDKWTESKRKSPVHNSADFAFTSSCTNIRDTGYAITRSGTNDVPGANKLDSNSFDRADMVSARLLNEKIRPHNDETTSVRAFDAEEDAEDHEEEESTLQEWIEQSRIVFADAEGRGGEEWQSHVGCTSIERQILRERKDKEGTSNEEINENDGESMRVNLNVDSIEAAVLDEERLIQEQLLKESREMEIRQKVEQETEMPTPLARKVHTQQTALNWDKVEGQLLGRSREASSIRANPKECGKEPQEKNESFVSEYSFAKEIQRQLQLPESRSNSQGSNMNPVLGSKTSTINAKSVSPELTPKPKLTFPLSVCPIPESIHLPSTAHKPKSSNNSASLTYTSSSMQTLPPITNPIWTNDHWVHLRKLFQTYCPLTPEYQDVLNRRVEVFDKGKKWETSKEYYYAIWRPSWNFRNEKCWELAGGEQVVARRFVEERREMWNEVWQGREKEVFERVTVGAMAGEKRRRNRRDR